LVTDNALECQNLKLCRFYKLTYVANITTSTDITDAAALLPFALAAVDAPGALVGVVAPAHVAEAAPLTHEHAVTDMGEHFAWQAGMRFVHVTAGGGRNWPLPLTGGALPWPLLRPFFTYCVAFDTKPLIVPRLTIVAGCEHTAGLEAGRLPYPKISPGHASPDVHPNTVRLPNGDISADN